jgi:transposase
MLGLGAATRIFVAIGKTDMRLGFNGLYALVVGKLQQNPQIGHAVIAWLVCDITKHEYTRR